MAKFCENLPNCLIPSWHSLHCKQCCQWCQQLPAPSNIQDSSQKVVDCCGRAFYFYFYFGVVMAKFVGICLIIACHHSIHIIVVNVVSCASHSQCLETFWIPCRWWLIVVVKFCCFIFDFGKVMADYCRDLPSHHMPSWHSLHCRQHHQPCQPLPAPIDILDPL